MSKLTMIRPISAYLPNGASKRARFFGPVLILAASVLHSAACVTVNVNFPESAVQQATDDYVKDLYSAKEKGKKNTSDMKAAGSSAAPGPATPSPAPKAAPSPRAWLELLEAHAYAEEASLQFKTNSAKAQSIKEKLRAHLDDVIAQKKAGNLGETNDGRLAVKTTKTLLQKKLEDLVKIENSDRSDLYKEIVSSNSMPMSRLKDVEKSFAHSFQSLSPSGTWIQDENGKWTQKP